MTFGDYADQYFAIQKQRTVFVLRHSGGLRLREVAETLGLALPTVKTHFARACLKLQTTLAAFDEGSAEEDS